MTQTVMMTLLSRKITYNGIELFYNPLKSFMFAIGMPIAYHKVVQLENIISGYALKGLHRGFDLEIGIAGRPSQLTGLSIIPSIQFL
ncbi:hypothetical protein LCGC14_1587910 [marine sediment metagenome]|uniref:Uncharacterized protein n=1 Tax=marine sediment metagenome TaxID=412755 RepID=A0A0F9IEV7_9ZZZZ